jgi:hypothetical protein
MDVGSQEVGLGRKPLCTNLAPISPDFDLNFQAETKQIQIKSLAFP